MCVLKSNRLLLFECFSFYTARKTVLGIQSVIYLRTPRLSKRSNVWISAPQLIFSRSIFLFRFLFFASLIVYVNNYCCSTLKKACKHRIMFASIHFDMNAKRDGRWRPDLCDVIQEKDARKFDMQNNLKVVVKAFSTNKSTPLVCIMPSLAYYL